MYDTFVRVRNFTIGGVYKHVLKPVFFMRDPEDVHDNMTRVGKFLGGFTLGQKVTQGLFGYTNSVLEQDVFGIHFKNPIGLSAGFDKNAELTDILPSVGFGFAELGSITGDRCEGNPKPRLWRLPQSGSLVVYYGLKNDGCEAISDRLHKKLLQKKFTIPMGMSVAMTNCEANLDIEKAIMDYAKAFRVMEPVADYITVNISCPNTLGGQPFVIPENLEKLFVTLDTIPTPKLIFIKLSPDLSKLEIDAILDVVRSHRVHGIICTNLTKKRDNQKIIDDTVPQKGGLSGKVVQDLADDLLGYIYRKEGKRFVLVGCGGVTKAEDAYKKIRLGATLVQMVTGMIFEGPQVISEINRGLVDLLKRDGFTHISQAVGIDNH